ncbi:hypothetical protein RD110_08210 [Rhodoferax koreense]|uniref:Polymer-forming cytoskeletal protein n=1 Tax=Rhodoferax koreensis TaxID=1842727 RepID=A0A1P8JTW2_9BURK|nr:polymer-forming cytoskeletal protein [Rhodoferax koreense]APW37183.1 hypothetical protein RD110_08210 [Rhodoferax koreense]
MMLALLAGLTLAVVLLPMLPALSEWRRPRDIVPLPIDETDALDPTFMATRFSAMLKDAIRSCANRVGQSELMCLTQAAAVAWPLSPAERDTGASRRVWHVDGDASLPRRVSFLVEVAATGSLTTATGGVYRALWSDADLHLLGGASVLRWAHGRHVTVHAGSTLPGRITAAQALSLDEGVGFTLLHAPTIQFLPRTIGAEAVAGEILPMRDWPAGLAWDAQQRRGFSKASVVLPARRAWQGDLVAAGDMELGADCRVTGSLKAHGRLRLARGCRVSGSIFADGEIQLGHGCVVQGAAVSETAVDVGANCRIGDPQRWATVAAPVIRVSSGAVVHGTVWAGEKGSTRSAGDGQTADAHPAESTVSDLSRPAPVAARERALA